MIRLRASFARQAASLSPHIKHAAMATMRALDGADPPSESDPSVLIPPAMRLRAKRIASTSLGLAYVVKGDDIDVVAVVPLGAVKL
jgi:hypothetical protein